MCGICLRISYRVRRTLFSGNPRTNEEEKGNKLERNLRDMGNLFSLRNDLVQLNAENGCLRNKEMAFGLDQCGNMDHPISANNTMAGNSNTPITRLAANLGKCHSCRFHN